MSEFSINFMISGTYFMCQDSENSEHTEKFAKRISGVPEMQSISEDAQEPPELS